MPSIALPVSLRGQLLSGTRTFSPASLFSANEPGVWFDPSDLTTLFQDPAGTTPVTTPGNTVGLMLDKSKGLTLGAEKVVNGTFDTNLTGWTDNSGGTGTAAVVGGRAVLTRGASSGDSGIIRQSFTTVVGNSYRLNLAVFASQGKIGIGASALDDGILNQTIAAGATPSFLFRATTTTTHLYLIPVLNNTAPEFDNISVRELPGNHATQATIAARPTYSIEPVGGRRNLLTWSEDFSVALASGGWTKSGVTASGQRITASAATGAAYVETTCAGMPASAITISAVFPPTSGRNRYAWVADRSVSPIASATFDLNSVSVVGKATAVTASIVTLPDGSVQCSVTHTRASAGTSSPQFALAGATHTSDRPSLTWAGGEFLDAKMQLELGSTATAYQRVTTQHDVTEAGVASVGYLYFDGASDAMATSTITPGTDKAQVFAGITKPTATSTYGLLYGLGNTASGGFETFVPASSATQVEFFMQGFGMLTCGIPSAPFSAVLTQAIDRTLPLPQISARLNGAALSGTSSGSAQTGNFLAFPLYLGARGGVSLPFSGHLYSLITRFGPTLDAPTIASTEIWVGDKTGIDVAKNISTTIYTRSGDTILDRANSTIERRAV